MSRILSGAQEPKLLLAYDLAKVLGVTLDYLVNDSPGAESADQLVMVSEDELTILKIARRLGANASIDRLLNVPPAAKIEPTRLSAQSTREGVSPSEPS